MGQIFSMPVSIISVYRWKVCPEISVYYAVQGRGFLMDDLDILKNLNDKQQEAVLETEGYVRVIAGAGSGKTKLLVSRYAYSHKDDNT